MERTRVSLAAKTNYCTHGGFRQHRSVYLRVLQDTHLHWSLWAQIQGSAELRSLLEALGENLLPCLFWLLGRLHSLAHGPSSSFKTAIVGQIHLSSTLKGSYDHTEPSRIIQDNLLLKVFSVFTLQSLFCHGKKPIRRCQGGELRHLLPSSLRIWSRAC